MMTSKRTVVAVVGFVLATAVLYPVPIEAQPACYPRLPAPQLIITGTENYTAGGVNFTRYLLNVTNYASFPLELFDPAPLLPPCGLNTNSSRTWVDIFVNGARYYGFCGLGVPADLNQIWFAIPEGQAPPDNVFITLTDRLCSITYTSNVVVITPPTISTLISQLSNPVLGLSSGQISSLSAKLRAALASIGRGNTIPASNQLRAFTNQVQSLRNDGFLSAQDAAILIAAANSIIESL